LGGSNVAGGRVGTEGYYFAPTVFADVTNEMAVAKEEIFGTVTLFMFAVLLPLTRSSVCTLFHWQDGPKFSIR
jgi:hypothetical protein